MKSPKFDVLDPISHCRICTSPLSKSLGSKYSEYSRLEFELHCCTSCGFQFVSPIVNPESIYNFEYYAGNGADPSLEYNQEINDWKNHVRFFEYEDFLKFGKNWGAKKEITDQVLWLDFGCGTGGLLNFLSDKAVVNSSGQTKKIAPIGYDPSNYAQNLRDRGLNVLDDHGLENYEGRFDIISCVEVLEHCLDPISVLHKLNKLLKPGGLLMLTTGNLSSPLAKALGFKFPYYLPEIHISLFNPKLLQKCYELAGFQPHFVHFEGSIKYRILRHLPSHLRKNFFVVKIANNFFIQKFLDYLYGFSKMPFGVKIK